ncbi:MAG: hydrolase [Saprospiraceae bacterium]|nr:hydrolase [Saprospiraceae bacterium]
MKSSLLNIYLVFAGYAFAHAQATSSQDLDLSDTSKLTYQTVGVVDNLPVFYTKLADRMTFPMSWLSGNYHDFTEWRKIARNKLMQTLLYDPPPVLFDPVVIGEEDRGTYVAKRIVLNISADSRILTYLLEPKGPGPFPAALVLHDHGARFDIGKEKVVRPFDVTHDRMNSSQEWIKSSYGGNYIGDELAKAGYICFVIDALNWGDRGGGGYAGQQALSSNLLHLGASLAGVIAYEDMRSVDYLSSVEKVDTTRIAAIGLSMGSFRAFQIAALKAEIDAAVSICWMAPIKDLIKPGENKAGGNSAYTMLHPEIFKYLDHMDIAGIACPKPMLFYHGRYDGLFPVPAVEKAYQKLHEIWNSQNADSRLETKIWDVKHEFSGEMQKEAFQWLNRQFGIN